MTVQEHTGTAIWWCRPYDPTVNFQQMMVTDAESAVAAALREGYLPRDAEVVATEPTYTNRQHLAHGYKTGMEVMDLRGIIKRFE